MFLILFIFLFLILQVRHDFKLNNYADFYRFVSYTFFHHPVYIIFGFYFLFDFIQRRCLGGVGVSDPYSRAQTANSSLMKSVLPPLCGKISPTGVAAKLTPFWIKYEIRLQLVLPPLCEKNPTNRCRPKLTPF